MFDVGGLKATIELAGEAVFTAAIARARAQLDGLSTSARGVGTGLTSGERGIRSTATAAQSTTASVRALNTQAAALDVSLDAVGSSSSNAVEGLNATSDAADAASESQDGLATSSADMSEKAQDAMSKVGAGALGMGAAIGGGIALAIAKYSEFDQAMSQVTANADTNAKGLEKLRAAALSAGAATSFSATEAADAENELAKAGVSVNDILSGGLTGSLALAAAGQIGVADAAETAATALTQFKLSGQDIPHVADLLANGANQAQGGVDDLSMALKQGGLVAAQMGLSLDDTVGTLTAFASAGLIGSDAGTSLKTMLLALANPSSQAAETMKKLGIDAYDAGGQFIGTAKLAGVLKDKLHDKSQEERTAALATIFGSDAIRGANVLYDQGASEMANYTKNVAASGGAAKTAAALQNNLSGDLEKLGGSFDTLLISAGAGANGPGRVIVQMLTSLVNVVGEIPAPVQQAGILLGIATAAVLLFGGAALVAVPKVIAFNVALGTLATSRIPGLSAASAVAIRTITAFSSGLTGASVQTAGFSRTTLIASRSAQSLGGGVRLLGSALAGPLGIGLAAAVAGAIALDHYVKSLQASTEQYQNTIKTSKSAADLFKVADKGTLVSNLKAATDTTEHFQSALNTLSTNKFAAGLSLSTTQLGQRLKDLGKELATTAQSDMPAAQHAFSLLAKETDGSKKQLSQLLNSMPAYRDALVAQATAQGKTATQGELVKLAQEAGVTASQKAADSYSDEAQKADDLATTLQNLIDSINTVNDANQGAISKNADYQEALAGISDEVKQQQDAYKEAHKTLAGYTLTLDQSTASGSANAASLASVAGKAQAAAKAQFGLDQTTMSAKAATDKYRGTLAAQRQAFIDSAVKAGYNKDEVNKLADSVFKLPSAKEVKILAATGQANAAIDGVKAKLNSIPRNFAVQIGVTQTVKTNTIAPYVSQAAKDKAQKGLFNANGSVTHYYAAGGFENHVAQIASAGTTRVWNEPETEGELYAPLANSKRTRSREIMREGAKIFGDHYLTDAELKAVAAGGSGSTVGLGVTGTVDLGDGIIGIMRGVVTEELSDLARAVAKGKRS